MIPILAAALACALCTPQGRMAILAKAGAESFDVLEAKGRTLVRVMAVDPNGAALPVVTFIRGADGAAWVEVAEGVAMTAPIDAGAFAQAQAAAERLHTGTDNTACGGRLYSVQRRQGLGAMTAIEGYACRGEVQGAAERLASLALARLPSCRTVKGGEPFDRLAACLKPEP